METGMVMSFRGPGLAFVAERHALRPLAAGELLVRNRYTTICGSDLHTFSGLRKEACPTVLGHEIVGEIAAIGAGHTRRDEAGQLLSLGDRISWTVFAGDRDSCCARRGIPQKSSGLFKYGHAQINGEDVFHGGLSEYCILKPGTAILRLPEEVPLPVAATLNCAIATAAGALRLAGPIHGRRVLITGMGLLGLTCAAMCREAGAASVTAADVDESRLQLAASFGAGHLIHMARTAVQPNSADITFDMSGVTAAMASGLEALDIGGVAVWVGAVFPGRKVPVDAEQMIRRLLSIRGLHNYNYEDFKAALDFLSAHWSDYPFSGSVAAEFTLQEAQQAFDYALLHKPLRVGIRL